MAHIYADYGALLVLPSSTHQNLVWVSPLNSQVGFSPQRSISSSTRSVPFSVELHVKC
jgi:hypothetical protein